VTPELKAYLEEVRAELRLDPPCERQIMHELCTHVEERVQELRAQGVPEPQAVRHVTVQLGRPKVLSGLLYQAHSKGSLKDMTLAATPHVAMALLFSLGLWLDLVWAPVTLAFIVAVTLYGWWAAKPRWLFPWIGYALAPVVVCAYLSAPTLGRLLLWPASGLDAAPDAAAALAVVAFFLVAGWIVASTFLGVVRRDWILASLMVSPLPLLVSWLMYTQKAGGILNGDVPAMHGADGSMSLIFLASGLTAAGFVRVGRRGHKLAVLLAATVVGSVGLLHVHGSAITPGSVLLISALLLAFFFFPSFVEAKVGHGETTLVWDDLFLRGSRGAD